MALSILHRALFLSLLLLGFAAFTSAQFSSSDGYSGYSLDFTGDEDSVVYETEDTPSNASANYGPPDVYLNASVHVGEIDILVRNLSAKINLDAQVLQLLTLNAGVDASINRVSLTIQNVTAKVLLEARLGNVVLMVDDVLSSLDLNPILATLGQDLTSIVNDTTGLIGGVTNGLSERSFLLDQNILYSVNNYAGQTHRNRVLTQTGSIVDQYLDNDGNIYDQKTVGSYLRDMTFNGYNQSVVRNGEVVRELEYTYNPFAGLNVVSAIYINTAGSVVATQVLSESYGGGSSTVSDL